MKRTRAARRVVWCLAIGSLGLTACEPKPSNPPKPTTHIEVPADGEKRPVDLKFLT